MLQWHVCVGMCVCGCVCVGMCGMCVCGDVCVWGCVSGDVYNL